MATVSIKDLSFAYGSLPVLEGISFDVASGEVVALVGPSGCGKTTLLRCVAGLLHPTSGMVTIGSSSDHRERRCSFVFQKPSLLPWLTVRENLELPFKLQRQPVPGALLFEQLRELELEGFESSFPTDLSVGMAQRVALVRALAVGRTSILLDEPYSALDELNRRTLAVRLSSEVARKGLSAVVVTHSIHDAVYLANRVLVLSERPARIRAVVAVPLSHPRGASLWDGDGLGAYVARAREVLEQPS